MKSTFSLTPIGHVVSPVEEPVDENWGKVISTITLLPEFQDGLDGLENFSHAIIITFMHKAQFDISRHLKRRPRNLVTMPLLGIFSQRSKDRPNPIGLTAVKIMHVGRDYLEVQGLDAINGTPVLDIKPYYPHYDRIEVAVVPPWVDELMRGYF